MRHGPQRRHSRLTAPISAVRRPATPAVRRPSTCRTTRARHPPARTRTPPDPSLRSGPAPPVLTASPAHPPPAPPADRSRRHHLGRLFLATLDVLSRTRPPHPPTCPETAPAPAAPPRFPQLN